MWVPWPYTMVAAVVLAAAAWLVRPRSRWGTALRPFALEAALVCSLYSLWRIAGKLSVRHAEGAQDRAMWIYDAQAWLHLPSELGWQQAILPHPLIMQFANLYYAVAHVPAVIIVLLWLFIRHRDDYPAIRNALALLTAACLVIQLVAVMPPRFLPELGFVDTAHFFGQSVYPQVGTGANNQLSAMPSLHVGWAVLVAFAAIVAGRSRWRWLVLAHPALTCWAVVVTANHWWLDGIVAVAILAAAVALEASLRRALSRIPWQPAGVRVGPVDASVGGDADRSGDRSIDGGDQAPDGLGQPVLVQGGEAQP
jgi:hypothetical protein